MPISIPPTEEFALIEDAVVRALLTKTGRSVLVVKPCRFLKTAKPSKYMQIINLPRFYFPLRSFGKGSAEILPQMAQTWKELAEF